MQKHFLQDTLIGQERRAVTLYLSLFYSIYFLYDIVFFFLLPWLNNGQIGFQYLSISTIGYVCFLLLVPYSIIMIRRNKPRSIKYVYFCTYFILSTISSYAINLLPNSHFSDGNIVELFFILFSPIFINKRFFWFVTLGMILRYGIIGVALQTADVLVPISLIILIALVAYVMLTRFIGYIDAIQNSYGAQLEGIVKGIIATLELKDQYTRGHSERVAHYSQLIARSVDNYSDLELKSYYYACLLHDVGKVHIPDSILLKTSKLTTEEYEIIKTHTTVGADVVQNIKGLEYTVDVIRYHHERWDGKGYPEGLSGMQIPLLARITAIADAFDAMTSERKYRSAMSENVAYEEIINGSGTQFDPDLIPYFKKVFPAMTQYLNQQRQYQQAMTVLPEGSHT